MWKAEAKSTEIETELSSIHATCAAAQNEIRVLQEKLAQSEQRVLVTANEAEKLKEELSTAMTAAQDEKNILSSRVEALTAELAAAQEEAACEQHKAAELVAQLTAAQEAAQSAEKSQSERLAQRSEAAQRKHAEELAAELEAARQSAEEEQAAASDMISMLEQRTKELAAEVATARGDSQAAVDGMHAQLAALESGHAHALGAVREQLEELAAEAQSTADIASAAQARANDLEATLHENDKAIAEAIREREEAQSRLSAAISEAQEELAAQQTRLANVCDVTERAREEAESRASEAAAKVDELMDQLQAATAQRDKAQECSAVVQARLSKALDDAWELANQKTTLSDELAALRKTAADLQLQNEQTKSSQQQHITKLDSDLATAVEKADLLRTSLSEAEGRETAAKACIKALEAELHQVQQALQEAQSVHDKAEALLVDRAKAAEFKAEQQEQAVRELEEQIEASKRDADLGAASMEGHATKIMQQLEELAVELETKDDACVALSKVGHIRHFRQTFLSGSHSICCA